MRRATMRAVVAVGVAGALLVGCGDDDEEAGQSPTTVSPSTTTPVGARAEVNNAENLLVGQVTFTEREGKVLVEGNFRDLPPGFHGFHIHATGRCEPPFMSAGGHMTVGAQEHASHAGDQPVLMVLADGTAQIRFTTDRYTMNDLLPTEGRAVIVHAAADNYGNVPTRYAPAVDQMTKDTGDAGGRIACGVIRRP